MKATGLSWPNTLPGPSIPVHHLVCNTFHYQWCVDFLIIKCFYVLLILRAYCVTCKAKICKASSGDFIVVSCAGSWLFLKFGRLVLPPNTSCDELNPLLLIIDFSTYIPDASNVIIVLCIALYFYPNIC